ncbi:hypothetical protein GGH15_005245 [Coemansia sp. RSA 562]|nr:hypothetical protein GGH15_005245 [Coemansia sp. RSA 562]KAJ2285559.1 hypothetical protein IW141_005737 [Coemansia sp. RSA 355]
MADNSNTNNSTSGVDEDALASFTNFDGLDTDTANLFGSFTNDSVQTGTDDSIFGQLSATDLSGFNVDLTSLDMSHGDNMDLSSIQLMNLDEVSMSGVNPVQAMADDTAQMMAQLLGPNVHTTMPAPLAPVIVTGDQTDSRATLQPGGLDKVRKSRSSSVSSSDMGDIPLAQLTQLAPGSISQQTAPTQNVLPVAQQDGLRQTHVPQDLSLGASVFNISPTQAYANTGAVSTAPVNVQGVGMGNPHIERLMPNHPQQYVGQQQYMEQLQSAMNIQAHNAAIVSRTEDALAPPLDTTKAQVSAEPVVTENGSSGVESTILLRPTSNTSNMSDSALHLELTRPNVDVEATPLDELEQIEDQLCSLLSIASRAIRMMTGTESTTKLESTVSEFMHTVAQVQADLRYQHKKLVARGIPVEIVAGYQSDVAGIERDLVLWSDAAHVLAEGLDTGLKVSSK